MSEGHSTPFAISLKGNQGDKFACHGLVLQLEATATDDGGGVKSQERKKNPSDKGLCDGDK